MEQVATLMFQVPGGGGYTMSFNEVMELDLEWKKFLLTKSNDWFEEYSSEIKK